MPSSNENRNTFNDSDAEALLQMIGGEGFTLTEGNRGKSPSYLLMTPGGGIAARSGTTVSFADCTVYSVIGTTLTSAGITLPVGNMSTTAVAGSTYILAVFAGGALLCNWEDC